MAPAQPSQIESAAIRDQVKKGLSEVRTTVLGGQILLGFQYEALFQSAFEAISPLRKLLELGAFALLVVTMVIMIAPAAFHQISEHGESSDRQRRATRLTIGLILPPFALAIGLNIYVAMAAELGAAGAATLGVVAVLVAAFLWFGIELMAARPPPAVGQQERLERLPLKDRVSDMMTETRIILPGVQALLGFQFAAYLTQAFAKLPADARLAHDVSLGMLLASMVLLMTPAAFHRIAEDGRETERLCRLTVAMMLAALAALGLGLAADVYVATMVVSANSAAAVAAALLSAGVAAAVWFAYPILSRRGGQARVGQPIPNQGASRHA